MIVKCVVTVNAFNLLKKIDTMPRDDSPNYCIHVSELSLA